MSLKEFGSFKDSDDKIQKYDYKFVNPELSYDAEPNYQPYLKLSFFFYKLPEISDEQFHRHWETIHADLTIACKDFGVHKILRYVQHHATPECKERAKRMEAKGIPLMEFDGCSELYVKSWDDIEAFFSSPEFAKALAPDAKNLMQLPYKVYAGYENIIFGKAIPDIGSKDGVTKYSTEDREYATELRKL